MTGIIISVKAFPAVHPKSNAITDGAMTINHLIIGSDIQSSEERAAIGKI